MSVRVCLYKNEMSFQFSTKSTPLRLGDGCTIWLLIATIIHSLIVQQQNSRNMEKPNPRAIFCRENAIDKNLLTISIPPFSYNKNMQNTARLELTLKLSNELNVESDRTSRFCYRCGCCYKQISISNLRTLPPMNN